MARKLFEKQGIRQRRGPLAAGVTFVVYSDAAGTVLADISATSGGSAIAGSTIATADIAGLGPAAFRFYGPTDGTDTLYLRCPADTSLGVQEIEADEDERLDVLEAAGGGDVGVHNADTTGVHGITDTAQIALRNTDNTFTADQYIRGGHPWYDVSGLNTADTQTVITAAPAGSTIFFGPGAHTRGALTLKSGICVAGAGMNATTIILANASNAALFDSAGLLNEVEIRDLAIDANRANQTSGGGGIIFNTFTRSAVRRVRVTNTRLRGIYLFACTDSVVEGCEVSDIGTATPTIDGTQAGIIALNGSRLRMVNNRADTVRDSGILATGATDATIVGNTVRGVTYIGIALGTGSARITVASNAVTGCADNGIDVGAGTDFTVTANTIQACGGGIVGDGTGRCAVIGNNIVATTGTDLGTLGLGIAFLGAASTKRSVTIIGNIIHQAYGHGILLDGISDSAIIGNTVSDSSTVLTGKSGIELAAFGTGVTQNILVTGNRCFDTRGTKRQAYGLEITQANAGAVRAFGNDFTGNLTGALNDVGGVASSKYANTAATGAAGADPALAAGGGLENVQAHGAMGATETIDLANGNVHTGTLDAACTLTFTGAVSGKACSFTLVLTQNGTGGFAVTWPASVDWPGGLAPGLSTAANKVSALTFLTVDGGTTWLGMLAGDDLR